MLELRHKIGHDTCHNSLITSPGFIYGNVTALSLQHANKLQVAICCLVITELKEAEMNMHICTAIKIQYNYVLKALLILMNETIVPLDGKQIMLSQLIVPTAKVHMKFKYVSLTQSR